MKKCALIRKVRLTTRVYGIRRTSRAVKLKLDFVNVCTLYSLSYNYDAMDTHIIGVATN